MPVTPQAAQRVTATWLPPLALMAVIFFLSAQPDLNSGLGTIDLIGRKILHATEHGLLTFLWWRALRNLPLSVAIAITYACTDEFHQHFVSGRHGTPVDVGIDAIGAATAAILIARRRT
jgi:hypothetical protein